MRAHIDALGWLHSLWGAFGVLTGTSLLVLAGGTRGALMDLGLMGPAGLAAIWIFVMCGGTLAIGGALMLLTGRALRRRLAGGRLAALTLAVPNLVLVPFGTALGIYAFWVLLNDDARGEFAVRQLGDRR
jgi:hypothetical protein